jgi:hypothetical protein
MLGNLLKVLVCLVLVVALIDRTLLIPGDKIFGSGLAVVVVVVTAKQPTEKRIHG